MATSSAPKAIAAPDTATTRVTVTEVLITAWYRMPRASKAMATSTALGREVGLLRRMTARLSSRSRALQRADGNDPPVRGAPSRVTEHLFVPELLQWVVRRRHAPHLS